MKKFEYITIKCLFPWWHGGFFKWQILDANQVENFTPNRCHGWCGVGVQFDCCTQKTEIWLTLNSNKKVTPQVMAFIRRNIRRVNKWPTFLMKPRENKKNYRTRITETTKHFYVESFIKKIYVGLATATLSFHLVDSHNTAPPLYKK